MRDLPDDLVVLSEHRQRKAEATTMRRQLDALGWKAAVAEGRATYIGVSSGVLVAWRSIIACKGIDLDVPAHFEGRIAAAALQLESWSKAAAG